MKTCPTRKQKFGFGFCPTKKKRSFPFRQRSSKLPHLCAIQYELTGTIFSTHQINHNSLVQHGLFLSHPQKKIISVVFLEFAPKRAVFVCGKKIECSAKGPRNRKNE
jgi:hypothetical protein